MGLKMTQARDAETGRLLSVSDCEGLVPRPPFVCATEGCRAGVQFIDRHERQLATKTVEVAPHFRLNPRARHVGSCRYNTAGQMRIIARDSDSRVLENIEQGKYTFRLHILHDALKRTEQGSQPTTAKPTAGRRRHTQQIERRGRLNSYIRTLGQILTLRAKAHEDAELAGTLSLDYRGKQIPWKHFYFETEDFGDCFRQLERAGGKAHPVCLAGTVERIESPTEQFSKHKIRLLAPWVDPDEDGQIDKPVASIAVPESAWLDGIEPDAEILAYGSWRTNRRVAPNSERFAFLNLTLYPRHKDQVLVVS